MAEFCLACLNKISGTSYTEADFLLSREVDLCENCGKMVPVVVRRRVHLPKISFGRKKKG